MKLTDGQKTTLISCAVLLGLSFGALYYFDFLWGDGIINGYTTRTKAAMTKLETLKKNETEYKSLKESSELLRELKANFDQAAQRWQPDPTLTIMDILFESFELTGVGFTNISRSNPQDLGLYNETVYSIECFGRFHELGMLMNLLEDNEQRFMRIKSFTIDNDKVDDRPSIQHALIELGVYTFNPRPAAAQGAPATTTAKAPAARVTED